MTSRVGKLRFVEQNNLIIFVRSRKWKAWQKLPKTFAPDIYVGSKT